MISEGKRDRGKEGRGREREGEGEMKRYDLRWKQRPRERRPI
jgi:hypothetical protein